MVNQQNQDSWRQLMASFQTTLGGANEQNGFVLLGRDDRGDVMATQAIRLYDWSASNLKIEAEALRVFYADPDRHRLPGEECIVQAPTADQISGTVGLGGGVWYRPDYRGRQLGAIIPRIARCYALAHYNVDNLFALYSPLNIEKKLHSRSGYRDICGPVIMRNSRTLPNEDLLMTLCRQQPMDIVDDTFQFLVDWGTQVDTGVGARRA
jgi:hypothetical protein